MAKGYDGPDLTRLAMAAYKAILRDVAAGYQPPPAEPRTDRPDPDGVQPAGPVTHRIVSL